MAVKSRCLDLGADVVEIICWPRSYGLLVAVSLSVVYRTITTATILLNLLLSVANSGYGHVDLASLSRRIHRSHHRDTGMVLLPHRQGFHQGERFLQIHLGIE